MAEPRILVEPAGEAALLPWGLHMVRSGVERAFGGRLRLRLGVAWRWRAAAGRPWRASVSPPRCRAAPRRP